ncbi:MAG: alkaline phosphatase family protein [Myxococcales bacterium]
MTPRRFVALSALACFALAAACVSPKPVASQDTPAGRAGRVLLVSVDGMGQEVAQRCEAPVLRALRERGSSTLAALTTNTAKTLPSHTAMLTGVSPEKHGIDWNDAFHGYPKFPTLFEVVKRHRPELTTAMVAGKAKFATFTRPGALDWVFVPENDEAVDDEPLAQRAAALVREHRPNVLMLHLPGVDRAGHASGWASPEQCEAVAKADRAVGLVLDALREVDLLDQTVVFATADHGGFERTHKPTDGKAMWIPWTVAGPGIRAGLDLSTVPGLQVHIEDTFATACWLLRVPLEATIDGRPVTSVRQDAP